MNDVIIYKNYVTLSDPATLTFSEIFITKIMRKVKINYTAINRHPGLLRCSTSRNFDPFWQGKHFCDLLTEFSQTFSIISFQIAREEYLIGKKEEQINKKRVIRTTLFIN
jgi:hypothetical protein